MESFKKLLREILDEYDTYQYNIVADCTAGFIEDDLAEYLLGISDYEMEDYCRAYSYLITLLGTTQVELNFMENWGVELKPWILN